MRGPIVKKLQHERVPFERVLHDAALNADAAAVNQSHFAQSRRVRFGDVFLNDRWDISW